MKAKSITRFVALAAAAALALTACGDRGADEEDTGGAPDSAFEPGYFPQQDDGGEPVRGGTLTYADFGEGRSLDPTVTGPTAAQGATALIAIYSQLTRWNVDEGRYEPIMAEEVTPSDDFTEWTITLRPDVTFTDGTPFDADAVLGWFDYYMNSMGFDVSLIAPLWGGAEKVDDLTVKVTLKESWATFDSMLSRGMGYVVAPAGIANGPEGFQPIGAGPFVAGDYAPGESRTLNANPDHWDGAPYLDAVKIVWLGGDQTTYETVKGGTSDVGFVQSTPTVQADVIEDGFPRYSFLSSNAQLIMMNQSEEYPAHYDKVRQALARATDPESLHERIHQGKGSYGRTMFAPESTWNDGSVDVVQYDIEEASQLVEEAKGEGFDGTIHLMGLETSTDAMLALKGTWEAAGFTVETEAVRSVADWIQRAHVERSVPTSVSGLQLTDADPYQNLYSAFHSKAATNILGYQDPEMDALIEEFRATPADDPRAQEIINEIETRYQEEVPAITFHYYLPTMFWNDNVYGVIGQNDGMADFSKAWIKN